MMSFDKEALLLPPVAGYLYRQSFRWQQPELQFYEYKIDLYGFSRVKNLTIAIELKLKNWHRAFEQSLIYQLCADLVFIGMPKDFVGRVDANLLCHHGIGLLSIDENHRCRQIIPAAHSSQILSDYRNTYIELLKG